MSTMVVFIAGILTGWILEWLFFTFFVKKNEDVVSTTSLDQVSNQPISLEKEKEGVKKEENKAANPAGKTEEKAAPAPADDTKSVDDSVKKAAPEVAVTPQPAVKEEAKETVKKVSTEKTPNKKAATKPTKKSTKASSASTAKKDTANQKGTKKNTKTKTTKSDDLATLKGIGPKLAKSLSAVGINSFSELAKIKGEDLVQQLEDAGHKVVNKPALGNLAPQAKLAAKGDLDGLETLQKSL